MDSINPGRNPGMNVAIPGSPVLNSPYEVLGREGTIIVANSVNITGNNDEYNLNVFSVTGSVQIISQYAIVTAITDLSNMTDVYADLWDGTNAVELTAGNPGGAVLSGGTVGTFFTKDHVSTQAYSVSLATQCRMLEASAKYIGYPFIVTQKTATDTYIRFNYTTNTTLDFTMDIFFTYAIINGGSISPA